MGILPIINKNDAISATRKTTKDDMFSDNSLAALCARNFGCDLCLLLTNVNGVFDRPPNQKGANKLLFMRRAEIVGIGEKSRHERGGMESEDQRGAIGGERGVEVQGVRGAVGSGFGEHMERGGKEYDGPPPEGTLFTTPGSELEKQALMDVQDDKVRQVFSFAVFFF